MSILVTLAFSFQILCHTIEDVHILSGDVDVVEEVIVHKVPVALVVFTGQADILVHIEGNNILKGYFASLILLNQALVNTQRGRTGR